MRRSYCSEDRLYAGREAIKIFCYETHACVSDHRVDEGIPCCMAQSPCAPWWALAFALYIIATAVTTVAIPLPRRSGMSPLSLSSRIHMYTHGGGAHGHAQDTLTGTLMSACAALAPAQKMELDAAVMASEVEAPEVVRARLRAVVGHVQRTAAEKLRDL